jgi:O-succinylbenzoic acid--CoA ligase
LLRAAASRGFPVIITYGMTETCSQVCATPYASRFVPWDCGAGAPLQGVDVRIRDERIEVRGPMLMAGYLNDAPLTAGAWFDTGDLGELDARGCLHLHARRTDLIVTGGENAYPAEIERALEAFPGIAAAGVFGVPDETWGQMVAAALVAEREAPVDGALLDYLERRLAPHKRPRRICYVAALPRAPSGKLDRQALAALAPKLRPLTRSP